MSSGIIFDIMRFSTRDGPGIRTTVFLKGCPLACLWCHNPESQHARPELMLRPNLCIGCLACMDICEADCISSQNGIIITNPENCTMCEACADVCFADAREIVGRSMSVEDVMNEILKDRVFYEQSGGGVTFSGGEPLQQNEFLLSLLRACKDESISTAVDTSGYAPWAILDAVLPYVNLFLYDLKVIDDSMHIKTTGVSNEIILSNLVELSRRNSNIRVRYPVIPGVNDDPQAVDDLNLFLSSLARPVEVELLPYHPSGVEKYHRLNRSYALERIEPPSDETIETIVQALRHKHPITNRT